jgi:uncharacterized protein (TIGR02594 family)
MKMDGTILEPDWLLCARRELGTKERAGEHADNPRVVEYLSATRIQPAMQHDETPWCAAFVSWVLEQSGIRSTRSAAARSYLSWGQALDEPRRGCVIVLSRTEAPAHGHVGFYLSSTEQHVLVLGGNQSNSVSIQEYPRDRVLGYRWPVSS